MNEDTRNKWSAEEIEALQNLMSLEWDDVLYQNLIPLILGDDNESFQSLVARALGDEL